jgi:choline-sulfatase
MPRQPMNCLYIFSDEHTRDITGCYGHKRIKTPNIDALAARGTRFTSAYTNCPICVPARASLHTGMHVADNACWDNATPYHGQFPSWGHRLRERGHHVMSIGKLHFRSDQDDNGFTREIIPLHIVDQLGDLLGLIRKPHPPERKNIRGLAADLGPGKSTYADYDVRIRDASIEWLTHHAKKETKPWTLFVSFVKPHFPLIAPPEWYRLYDPATLDMPRLYAKDERPTHPAVMAIRKYMNYDDFFTGPEHVKRAIANYYAMTSFLDDNIGRVLDALSDNGFADNTRVVYTTDHGDNLGVRGLWGKSVMYEESTAIPMIVAGPDVPKGRVATTPTSLVDSFQTVLDCVGVPLAAEDHKLPGRSLWDLAAKDDPERAVLSEYHSASSITGSFLLRKKNWKYIHHEGFAPQLFDLAADPGETLDLGTSAAHEQVRAAMHAELLKFCDPKQVNERAFRDQEARIALNGGRDKIIARGDFGYSPVPGQKAAFA